MQIVLEVKGSIDGTLVGEPNDLYEQIERIKAALQGTQLGYTLTIDVMPRVFSNQGVQLPEAHRSFDKPLGDTRLEELELGVRAYNCLSRAHISTVQELIELSRHDMEMIPNMGNHSINEVEAKLAEYGLVFLG